MMTDIHGLPLIVWVLIGMLLLSQGTWLFIDARKRDANAWFWGIWGLIQSPWPFIFYLIFVRKIFARRRDSQNE